MGANLCTQHGCQDIYLDCTELIYCDCLSCIFVHEININEYPPSNQLVINTCSNIIFYAINLSDENDCFLNIIFFDAIDFGPRTVVRPRPVFRAARPVLTHWFQSSTVRAFANRLGSLDRKFIADPRLTIGACVSTAQIEQITRIHTRLAVLGSRLRELPWWG